MSKEKRNIREVRKSIPSPFKDYWDKNNYILIAACLVILTLGYIFMAHGNWDSFFSLTLSPITLLIAYVIVIPIAILFKSSAFFKKKTNVPSKD